MSDLVAWLRAQLDEDERVAKAATSGGPWREVGMSIRGSTRLNGTDVLVVKHTWPQESAHMVRHDPLRVLAEVEAKRRILDLHAIIWRDIGWLEDDNGERDDAYAELPVCGLCVPKHSHFPSRADVPEGECATVRLLAEPYAGRPGYDEARRGQIPHSWAQGVTLGGNLDKRQRCEVCGTWEDAAAAHSACEADWHCQWCGSNKWVAASLTGPVGYGGRAIRQCVPCGHYSSDPVPDAGKADGSVDR